MKGKNSFIGLNARQVLGQVGRLGEDIAAALFHGDIVSDHPESAPFADVVNTRSGLAVQVKMCNGRHAQRPLPRQVLDLHREVTHPFLYDKGVYAFIFYSGVDESSKRGRKGKSMIWSRKFSRGTRRQIIAHELQYVYVVDVGLLRLLLKKPRFIKTGALVYVPEEKPDRDKVLYLNRTFMKGFLKVTDGHRALLDEAYGKRGWLVRTRATKLLFTDAVGASFVREVPVHFVGSSRVVRSLERVAHKPPLSISLECAEGSELFLAPPPVK